MADCAGGDWEKYLYAYRLWGRLTYNPGADPDIWRRQLRREYGPAAQSVESALAKATRILPLVTTAHDPSAANNNYWPEVYLNMSIVDASNPRPYTDSPNPKRFGMVSPLDPQLFTYADGFAEELARGSLSGKVSPVEVAQQLEDWSQEAAAHMVKADQQIRDRHDPAYRRMAVDTAIVSGLGRFFAWKLRAAVMYGLFERSAQDSVLKEALKAYRTARQAWADLAVKAEGVYVRDITFGLEPQLRGHWSDRLEAIDRDIAAMEQRAGKGTLQGADPQVIAKAAATVLARPRRTRGTIEHAPPASFHAGQELAIQMRPSGGNVTSVLLWYRRVNQAETFRQRPMLSRQGGFQAAIEGDYTNSAFPLQYYFELRSSGGQAWLYPGFGEDFLGQPYFVVRQA